MEKGKLDVVAYFVNNSSLVSFYFYICTCYTNKSLMLEHLHSDRVLRNMPQVVHMGGFFVDRHRFFPLPLERVCVHGVKICNFSACFFHRYSHFLQGLLLKC